MPSIQAEHLDPRSQRSDALLGTVWAWDEDDEPEAGAAPGGREHDRDPGPSAH